MSASSCAATAGPIITICSSSARKSARFNHVAFGVENIDELMTGLNEMQRRGWTSREGLGRHRATSIIFCYMDCPAGGTCEYMCDSDYLTDAWQPNLWEPELRQPSLARATGIQQDAGAGMEGPAAALAAAEFFRSLRIGA